MTIPATHAEIEQLYLQCELNGYRSVCISACQSEDGALQGYLCQLLVVTR